VIARPEVTASIRKVHDFLTVGAPTPLQQAGVAALGMPDSYFEELATRYEVKRDRMLGILENAGFRCYVPKGAYYIMCGIDAFGFRDDVTLCRHLIEEIGVAAVPGSSFFSDPAAGQKLVRFCFAKKEETLELARERLGRLKG
jgi:aspartate/methionine/tyrosine aminotransferase